MLAAAEGRAKAAITRRLGICVDTVRKWRARFCAEGLAGLADWPRPGRQRTFPATAEAEVKALACALPAEAGVPLARWRAAELAAEAVSRGTTGCTVHGFPPSSRGVAVPQSSAVPGPAAPGDDRLTDLATLGEQLPRFMRLVHALKAGHSTEGRAALVLLFPLERLGPLRQGALAELVHADPSTVSRHVAALIEQGLVHRVADETDGRASRLVVTDAGRAALGRLRAEREAHLARVTADWPAADLTALTHLLGRFLDDLAASLPSDPAAAPVAVPSREGS